MAVTDDEAEEFIKMFREMYELCYPSYKTTIEERDAKFKRIKAGLSLILKR